MTRDQQIEAVARAIWTMYGESFPHPTYDDLPLHKANKIKVYAKAALEAALSTGNDLYRSGFNDGWEAANGEPPEAAVSTDAEPVAWYWIDLNGRKHVSEHYPPVMLGTFLKEQTPLYEAPSRSAPSVAVKALHDLVEDLEMRAVKGVVDCSHGVYFAAKAALSAQGQDVSGWKLVPLDDEGRCIADSALPHEMIEAGIRVQEQVNDDNSNYVAGETTDWDCGMVAVAIYRAMLSAAPAAKQEEKP